MAITVITEGQASAAEYFYNLILKVREILYANRAVLKAGSKSVEDRIYYGTARVIAQTPAIQMEGIQDDETYGTMDPENYVEFSMRIWFYNLYLDSEDNEKEIHQLGDRVKEVFRQNEDIDGLAVDCMPRRTQYGLLRTPDGGFFRAGQIELWIKKFVGG